MLTHHLFPSVLPIVQEQSITDTFFRLLEWVHLSSISDRFFAVFLMVETNTSNFYIFTFHIVVLSLMISSNNNVEYFFCSCLGVENLVEISVFLDGSFGKNAEKKAFAMELVSIVRTPLRPTDHVFRIFTQRYWNDQDSLPTATEAKQASNELMGYVAVQLLSGVILKYIPQCWSQLQQGCSPSLTLQAIHTLPVACPWFYLTSMCDADVSNLFHLIIFYFALFFSEAFTNLKRGLRP